LTSAVIPAGTVVDTFFIHNDHVGADGNVTLTGSVTFLNDVLGIQTGPDGLVSQSTILGAPGTTYLPAGGGYELAACPGPEGIVLSADRRTVTVCATTGPVSDDIRVITKPRSGS
jgi:hypothetical protein